MAQRNIGFSLVLAVSFIFTLITVNSAIAQHNAESFNGVAPNGRDVELRIAPLDISRGSGNIYPSQYAQGPSHSFLNTAIQPLLRKPATWKIYQPMWIGDKFMLEAFYYKGPGDEGAFRKYEQRNPYMGSMPMGISSS